MKYSAAVLDRVRDPKYVGWLPRDATDVGTGEAGTLERGTVTRIQVRIGTGGRIDEAVFKVFGCSAAIASASLVAERLHGAMVDEARGLESLAIVAELELPVERANVASLAVEAARRAIEDWERKR
jgi:nitrogen fixation protein NifU and related proteins